MTHPSLRKRPIEPHESAAGLLHGLFEATVRRTPGRVALIAGGETVTYGSLDARATRLAHTLAHFGIGPGSQVGLLLERGIDTYVALLATLKVGAAYVPMDAAFPAERVTFIVVNARVALVLTQTSLAPLLEGSAVPVLALDVLEPAARQTPLPCRGKPDDMAYIIYTSGSTGQPKGVAVSHRSVTNFVEVATAAYGITAEDRVYQGFTVAFDFSIEEIWTTFHAGATLIVGPPDVAMRLGALGDFLRAAQVSVLCAVPTLLGLIEADLPALRLVNVGGEQCPAELVERWSRPGRRFINTYGPTEATASATLAELAPGRPVTIGRALPTYRLHVVNERLEALGVGVAGEILIGGVGLATGYVGLPALTAERFIADPFSPADSGERLYRTGDLGRWTADGELEFLGRIDLQVKIRGHRVELSEIEAVLLELRGVGAAVAAPVRLDGSAPPSEGSDLVVYVVPEQGVVLAPRTLRDHLVRRLPRYMIPGYIELVEALPRLASGKVDRAALPAPSTARQTGEVKLEAPRGELEVAIAHAVVRVFQTPVSATADFFGDLGGHSLLAARLASLLRENPATSDVGLADLYAHPSVRALATHLAGEQTHAAPLARSLPPLPSTVGAGLVQALCLYALFGLPGLGLALGHVAGHPLACFWLGVWLYAPVSALGAIAAKWLLIGRFKPGSVPLWSSAYVRWWIVRRLQALVPLGLVAGSPLINVYLRAMGAQVGRDVVVSTTNMFTFDLLVLEAGTCVGPGASLWGYTIESGRLRAGHIRLERGACVGAASVLAPDTRLGPDAVLGEQSYLPTGAGVPAGSFVQGSPARPVTAAANWALTWPAAPPGPRADGWPFYVLLGLGVLPAIPALATLAGYVTMQLLAPLTGWPVAAVAGGGAQLVALWSLLIGLKHLAQHRLSAGMYAIGSAPYRRKWLVDKLMELAQAFSGAVYATVYLPPLLRLLGARIGPHCEVSTVAHISPDLLQLDAESFVADAVTLGPPRLFRGWLQVAPVQIGRRSFIGNAALVPIGASIPEGCLVGVQAMPPDEPMASGSAWLGLPAFFLPRREVVAGFAEADTYRPSHAAYALRCCTEALRITLPPAVGLGVARAFFWGNDMLVERCSAPGALLLAPAWLGGLSLFATLAVAACKWGLVGRYRPRVAPLWSSFVRRTELVTGLYENITVPLLLSLLLGTPFARWVLALFGARIGRSVCLETTFLTEFDLVQVGDGAAVESNVSLQSHLFEDRIMKLSHVTVGAGATLQTRAVVLYDSLLEPGASLGGLSLLMKGETLRAHTHWAGSPARPAAHEALESGIVTG